MSRLWNKGESLDDLVLAFTVGSDHLHDARLVAYDVRASIAHAEMLAACGYLSAPDLASITEGLRAIGAAHAQGDWQITQAEEDVHTALENRLVARCGEAGRRVHLGRSRNDQVLVALRLYLKDVGQELAAAACGVARELDLLAARHGDLPLPGYTHLQRAMPSSVALWSGGYASEIRDDAAALERAMARADRNPLGSAAGYGVPVLALDRAQTTRALGFASTHEPVTAVQLSRGKAEAALVFELALLAQDLGRMAGDLCLYTMAELALVRLPTAFTTGSSIMPQKRNPDVFELLRAHSCQIPIELQSILALTAKMPSGYHRDLQLIKAPLFRAIDQTALMLAITAHALPAITFDEPRCRAAIDPSMHATERAYRLVAETGIPFRDAYLQIARES